MTMTILKYTVIRSVILLSTILGYGTVAGVHAQPSSEQAKNPYPQEVTEAYLQACLQGSVDQGLTEQQSQSLCDCTLEQFQTRYTFDEFVQVYGKTDESEEPPSEIFEISAACAGTLTQ
ncbi:MAG: hypothetical protein KA714_25470 [Limnoraphis sp. WC205]|jgi:hypothetical protein|nr:hypothetical protein [Limnoraphis sp. WC205]